MSLFKKVIKAVKKFLKAAVPARKAPKKRRLKARKAPFKTSRKPNRAVKRPAARVASSKPKAKAVKVPAPKPVPAAKTVAVKSKTPQIKVKSVGILVGGVTHYFDRIKVCVIRIDREHIKKGDRLLIKGPKGEIFQNVSSMQIENEDVTSAKKGQMIGLKVSKPVFVNDEVYKV